MEIALRLWRKTFLTQQSNWGLLHCRQILYQLSYEGSPSEEGHDVWKYSRQEIITTQDVLPGWRGSVCLFCLSFFLDSVYDGRLEFGDLIHLCLELKSNKRLLWWLSSKKFTCQCRRHSGFHPWSGKISHTAQQLSPWATTLSLCFRAWGLQLLKPACPRDHAP